MKKPYLVLTHSPGNRCQIDVVAEEDAHAAILTAYGRMPITEPGVEVEVYGWGDAIKSEPTPRSKP